MAFLLAWVSLGACLLLLVVCIALYLDGKSARDELTNREYVKLLWVPSTARVTIDEAGLEVGATLSFTEAARVVPFTVAWTLYAA